MVILVFSGLGVVCFITWFAECEVKAVQTW